jgi:hypothetical protein
MRIIQLTESEAANADILANVAEFLLNARSGDVTHMDVNSPGFLGASAGITQRLSATPVPEGYVERKGVDPTPATFSVTPHVGYIAPEDNPSTGFPPDPPAAAPRPDPMNPATLGFGSHILPFPGATVPVQANLVNPPTSADLDAKGLPWDPRIHSSGDNKKNADGSWRKKRGVPETLIVEVEAELRKIMSFPALAQAPVSAPVIPLPPIPAAVPTVPAAEPMTFSSWMEELTPALNRQLITQELFMQLTKNAHGPDADMNALVMRSDLIPPVRQAMKEWLDANHPGWANAAA